MYVFAVSKRRSHGSNGAGTPMRYGKKSWYLYFLDENGKFHTQKVTFLQAMYYKTQIVRIKRVKKL